MQRVASLFLVLLLVVLPVLSIATPVTTTTPDHNCITEAITQANSQKNHHNCCQMLENHCSSGQCDCESKQFSSSLATTASAPLVLRYYSEFHQHLSSPFISHRPKSLYRPPRAIL